MDEREIRLGKVEELKKLGIDPYPYRYERTHTIADVLKKFSAEFAESTVDDHVKIAGRLTGLRRMGRAIFADLSDTFVSIQIHLAVDRLGEEKFSLFHKLVDRGDILGVEGYPFYTKTREPTVEVVDFTILAKALLPLPEKWHGLQDAEIRRRQRYLHLIMEKEARELFIKRTRIIAAIRRFLDERGFFEVKTPILQPVYGGAEAEPFDTYHNALDMTLHLRIATELYLKRLIVGGFEKVYEIGENFRNEGVDALHNPEFTALELYSAYADYQDMMLLLEELIAYLAKQVCGSMVFNWLIKDGEAVTINLTPPFRRYTMLEAITQLAGVEMNLVMPKEQAENMARSLGVSVDAQDTVADIIAKIFDEKVQPRLVDPTFVLDYPAEVCPLAKKHRSNPLLAERFELFIAGMEFANAFSELSDPVYQAEQFEAQGKRREMGRKQAHPSDTDYVTALEYGLPPTGGLGIGIDRLVMLLTETTHIQDVILFPLKKEK